MACCRDPEVDESVAESQPSRLLRRLRRRNEGELAKQLRVRGPGTILRQTTRRTGLPHCVYNTLFDLRIWGHE
jgi:hypothetical protein